MGFTIVCLARPDDDERVGELLVRSFVETYARKLPDVVVTEPRKHALRDMVGKRAIARVFVAQIEGVLAGTVAVWLPGTDGSEAWRANAADLRQLAVDDAYRDGSISRALLDAAEADAKGSGAIEMCLHVRRGAAGVRRLYERRGYVRDETGDLDHTPDVYLEGFFKRL